MVHVIESVNAVVEGVFLREVNRKATFPSLRKGCQMRWKGTWGS